MGVCRWKEPVPEANLCVRLFKILVLRAQVTLLLGRFQLSDGSCFSENRMKMTLIKSCTR